MRCLMGGRQIARQLSFVIGGGGESGAEGPGRWVKASFVVPRSQRLCYVMLCYDELLHLINYIAFRSKKNDTF